MPNILSIILNAKADQVKNAMNAADKHIEKTRKTIAGISKIFKKMALVMTAAVGATAAVMVIGTKRAIKYGIEIDKLAKTTGLTTQAISRLKFAMDQEHASIELLEKALPLLARRMMDANSGLETYARSFRNAGIDIKTARGELKSTDEILLELSDFMRSGASDTEKMAIASELLGRSGKELIPFLKLGRAEIEKLGDEAERLGIVLSSQDVLAMKQFDDALTSVKAGIKGIFIAMANQLTPILRNLADWIVGKLPEIRERAGEILEKVLGWIPIIIRFGDRIFKVFMKMKLGLNLVWTTAKTVFTRMPDFFLGLVKIAVGSIERIVTEIRIAFSFISVKISELGEKIRKKMLTVTRDVIIFFKRAFREVLPQSAIDGMNNILKTIRQSVAEIGKIQDTAFSEFRKKQLTEYPDTLKEGTDILKGIWNDYLTDISPILDEFIQLSKDKMTNVGQAILGFWGLITQKSKSSIEETGIAVEEATTKTKTRWQITLEEIKSVMGTFTTEWGSWGQQLGQVAVAVAQSMQGALSGAMHAGVLSMIDSSVKFRDAMGQIWKDLKSAVLRAITDMIARWLVFQALTGFGFKIPGLGGGGPTPQSFQQGGEVPAILHKGEFVIPKSMVDLMKRTRVVPAELINAVAEGRPPRAQAFQAGGMVGGGGIALDMGGINITITQQPGESADRLLDQIVEQIRNKTASAVAMAMESTNLGNERAGEAV